MITDAATGSPSCSPSCSLRWTLVDPPGRGAPLATGGAARVTSGAAVDVAVDAPPDTPLRALRGNLLRQVGRPPDAPLLVDGQDVDGALVGRPPLLHGAVLTVGGPGDARPSARGGPAPPRPPARPSAPLELHVTAGPDAGTRFPLAEGATGAGRGAATTLRIADPETSREHVEITRVGHRVTVRDVGSRNGTLLGGRPLDTVSRPWPVGAELRLGGSALVLRATPDGVADGVTAATQPDGAGRLLVNPTPRLREPLPTTRVVVPAEPAEPASTRPSWIPALLPLLISVPLAWWLRQPSILAFAALAPLMAAGQHLADRRARRSDRAAALARHAEEVAQVTAQLRDALAQQAGRLREDHPDLATVSAVGSTPLTRLWERRRADGDVLVLRLGTGEAPAAVLVSGGEPPVPPVLREVPVTVDLRRARVTGLAGPRRAVLGLARALVGQAATWHSPHDLRIVVRTASPDAAPDWAWTAWLPHADSTLPPAPADQRPVPGHRPPPGPGDDVPDDGGRPRTLLVLDGADRLRRDPQVAAVLADGAARGVYALCLADVPARLPAECGATVELDGDTARLALRDRPGCLLRPDLAAPGWAERLARDLARLQDATPVGGDATLPVQVRLVDLLAADGLHGDPLAAHRVLDTWRRNRAAHAPATTTVVGRTAAGPWQLDLRRDGPHALVAGTTGAGKSELLVSLVAGLAVAHPPDRLALLLVDYKGGTAFGRLGDLPHTVGVLTDLDAALARRALASLQAELRRREALLRTAGVADAEAHEASRPPDAPPLARLVIVVDEFRVLAEELPELLHGLVRVAAVGRSLAVHLVLATQRPAGAVSADIRANVNLRVALRVRDRGDSDDVIEAPDAASLPADRPGRGLFRVGGGDPVVFQAARVTGHAPRRATASVRTERPDPAVPTRWLTGEPGAGRHAAPSPAGPVPSARAAVQQDDLSRLVESCREAARQDGLAPARPPWLPPLPAVLRLPPTRPGSPGSSGAPGSPDSNSVAKGAVIAGLVDLPAEQRRAPLAWVPPEGHLAVVGAPGSGRTTALRTLAGAALGAGAWHVHVLDGGGGLAELETWPGIGTVTPVTDVERVERLIAHLASGPRIRGGTPALLLLDGWEQAIDAWYPVAHGRPVDDLLRLVRDGARRRVHLAVTGGRAVLSGPLAGLLTQRWLLRAADPADLVLWGVPASLLPGTMPAGRLMRIVPGGAEEAQLALADRPLTAPPVAPPIPPLRLRPLPDELGTVELLAAVDTEPGGLTAMLARGVLPLGFGGDQAAPDGPPARAGCLVAGPPGSGRSTALATAGRVLRAAGRPVVAVARKGSPVAALRGDGAHVIAPDDAGPGLLPLLDASPDAVLLLDEPPRPEDVLLDEHLGERLDRHRGRQRDHEQDQQRDGEHGEDRHGTIPAHWPSGPGPHLIVAAQPGQAAVAVRGVLARLREGRCGLLLYPVAPGDGDALGVQLAARTGGPPGRAVLVSPSRTGTVQIAAPSAIPDDACPDDGDR